MNYDYDIKYDIYIIILILLINLIFLKRYKSIILSSPKHYLIIGFSMSIFFTISYFFKLEEKYLIFYLILQLKVLLITILSVFLGDVIFVNFENIYIYHTFSVIFNLLFFPALYLFIGLLSYYIWKLTMIMGDGSDLDIGH